MKKKMSTTLIEKMPSKMSELSDCNLHKGIHYLGFISAHFLYSVIRHNPILIL